MWYAECLLKLGDAQAALAAVERGLSATSGSVHLHQLRSVLLMRDLHDPERALAAIEEARRQYPENHVLLLNKASILLTVGRPAAANEALVEAEELKPEDAGLVHRRAEIMLHHGRYEEAKAAYEKALRRAPRWPVPRFGLLHLLFETGAYEEGLRVARETHALLPGNAYVNKSLVAHLRAAGKEDEAREHARTYTAGPGSKERPSALLVYLHAAAGQKASMERVLAQLAQPSGESLYLIAAAHAILGDADGVVRHLERSLRAGHHRHEGSVHVPDLRSLEDPRISGMLERLEHHDDGNTRGKGRNHAHGR
jgi:tetratricopeptide (TPR) repeat protein